MTDPSPLDDFRALASGLPPADHAAQQEVAALLASAFAGTSPGRLEDVAGWLAGAGGRVPPGVLRPQVVLFAGTHGIAPDAAPRTAAMVELCAAGGAPVNGACLAHDLGLKVFDLALHLPTGNIARAPALDARGCAATVAFGMEAVAGGVDLLCIGDLGGGELPAAALCAALLGGSGRDWMEEAGAAALIDQALELHGPVAGDPAEALRRLGGRETAAIAGAILSARTERVPVVLDGLAALAAAAVLRRLDPAALDHCVLADTGSLPAQRLAAERLGLRPLLDLRLPGGGLGAALAAGIAKAAALAVAAVAAARSA